MTKKDTPVTIAPAMNRICIESSYTITNNSINLINNEIALQLPEPTV